MFFSIEEQSNISTLYVLNNAKLRILDFSYESLFGEIL